MTMTNVDLSEFLAKHDKGDFLHNIAGAVLHLIMEADIEGMIDPPCGRDGAGHGADGTSKSIVSKLCNAIIRLSQIAA